MIVSVVLTRKKRCLLAGLIILLLLLLFFAGRFRAGGATTPATGQQRLVPIYYVDTPEKKLAISFDASWGAEYTPKILETLQEHNLKTTFFLTGFWIDKYPELVKRIAEEGHELGNHTATHPHLNTLDKEAIKKELQLVHDKLHELSGQTPILFRPPFGEYSNKVIEAATELNYYTIQWSVDSLDWKDISKEEIVNRVTRRIHPGAIVLFHNNGIYTAEALPEILANAKREGYEIVKISDLIYKKNYYIDPSDGAQKKKD
ncbi:MAG: polysaccharide deacetylase family protein [Firmicutes bacterium]|nr:polysaccharide deacetylase family protein [Bacillota bacterium]